MPRCKYCHMEIRFIRTEKGRLMPVEAESITVITPQGKTIKQAFIPHFDNCKRRVDKVDPDSKAAYAHWNEEAERVYLSEHPEVFRGDEPPEPDDYERYDENGMGVY